MATWYISENGNNSNPGTLALPKRNFYNMITSASVVAGDIIYAYNGVYPESQQMLVPAGVSIQGQSMAGVVINSTYAAASQPLFKLETINAGGVPGNGNQTISNLTINGNNTTYGCIRINFRSNVKVRYLTINNFTTYGIVFNGQANYTWTATSVFEPDKLMPNYWTVGNEITNCVLYNNTQGATFGNIGIGQQDGIIISYNTITQPIKGSGSNCAGIKYIADGWNKNTDMHHNSILVTVNPSNRFNFALEMWYELGGCKYYNNTIVGTCDFDCTTKGASTYSVWFHHNEVGPSSYVASNLSGDCSNLGLDIEANCSDMVIEKNYIHNVWAGIYFSHIWPIIPEHNYDNVFQNIRISCNKFINIGIANGATSWEPIYGIYMGREQVTAGTSYMTNIQIWNNVFTRGQITADTYYALGIWLPQCDMVATNISIRNNIIVGFTGGTGQSAAIYGTGQWGTNTISNLYITNNDFYGNANNIQLVSGYSPSPYVNTPNLTSNPNYDANYRITSSSPAYRAGTYVGLIDDYDGVYWANPPSIGVYEVADAAVLPTVTTTTVTNITSSSASSGGNVTNDGGANVTVRGVCWSTSQNPTTANSHTSDGFGTGSFTSSITGLSPSTTYYVRAYATNSVGTAYGNQTSFTSLAVITIPSVTTSSITSITSTTASGGGNVTSSGGATVTARGVCWDTSPSPTITDSLTVDGSGTGTFTSSITGLTGGVTYYVRAYATNSVGTAYGNDVSFVATLDDYIYVMFSNLCRYTILGEIPEEFTEYVLGDVIFRKSVRDGYFILDKTLTPTGFSGIEGVDWENIRQLK